MKLVNSTRMVTGYTMGLDPSGRELLVIAIKGTFRLPDQQGGRLELAQEQSPLTLSDEFFGKPGLSAPRCEIDYAPRKQRCDILLNGCAYAPGGRPAERVTVGLKIGTWSKSFSVIGDRHWFWAGGPRATAPIPFTRLPFSYDQAFGGTDTRPQDPSLHVAFMANPSGCGFHGNLKEEWIEGSPLPNTEEPGMSVTRPDGPYRPMSFGSVGRHWDPRRGYAGTYDQRWLDEVFPFLPADFDEQYYQAAPRDQQLDLPVQEQMVSLLNLTSEGRCDFILPHFEAPIHIFPRNGPREDLKALTDTVMIEPDLQRVTMTWRVARPLRTNMFEIAQVLVGRKGADWWQQRDNVKFPVPVVMVPMRRPAASERLKETS